MSKSPAFQFYPADFLADENVSLMTLEERGAYITLLCYCWNEGSIPGEVPRLAKLCGVSSEVMEVMWKALQPCFVFSKKNDGRLIHSRLEKEKKKQKEFSKTQSDRAKKRWASEKSGDATALPAPHTSGNALQSSSLSLSSNKPKSQNKFSDEDMKVAVFIWEKVLALEPNHKKPNLEAWANDIRLAVQEDKRTHDGLTRCFSWANRHDFWRTRCLCPANLRKNYDRFSLESKNQSKGNLPGPQITPNDQRTGGSGKLGSGSNTNQG